MPYSTLLKRPDLRHRGSNLSPHSDLYVTVQPYADSKPLTVHSQTPYKSFRNGRAWNQWLSLPVNYSTLPSNTQLAITLWDVTGVPSRSGDFAGAHHIPFGGTTISLFDEEGTLRTGRQKCRVHRHKAADGFSDTTTPSKEPKARTRGRRGRDAEDEDVIFDEKRSQREAELERLVGLMKKHEVGEIPENKWLDQMVFRQIERLERESVRNNKRPKIERPFPSGTTNGNDKPHNDPEGDPNQPSGTFFLYIEFPRFDHPIVFTDHEYPPPPVSAVQAPPAQNAGGVNFKPPPEVQPGPGIQSDTGTDTDGAGGSSLFLVYDPEVGYADNPAENKHRRLIRGQRNALDRDLKPNPKMRDFLNSIMLKGPTAELTDKEKDEVWRFRHHLTRDKRALTKLVKSVNWNEAAESRQAISLLGKWAEIDVDDALELLGPGIKNREVRGYAVERLRKADDEELLLYLLQLVQALKFEPKSASADAPGTDGENGRDREQGEEAEGEGLASFLIARSAANLKLGNFLHWYLMVELDQSAPPPPNTTAQSRAATRDLYARVSYDFMVALASTPEGQARRAVLLRQGELVTILAKISGDVQNTRGDRLRKIEGLKKMLSDPKNDLLKMNPPLPLPLDPDVKAVGVLPEECNVFKSTLSPFYLAFKTESGEKYPLIFKTGDDLRQDQLVIQIIALMNRLLLNENLDLKLTPYRILATSTLAGAVQFIPSAPLSSILTSPKFGSSILGYLRHHNPAEGAQGVLGVRREAMENYVKSVAGYCVITYLLGVGDRHLDNLLLTPEGRFFHIDFGYILGRDPKPMAPLMKLTREMVEGMGGPTEPQSQFDVFKQYAFTAYTTLRRSAPLILNLFALMQDAKIPGLMVPQGENVVKRVEERFKLDVGEEEAVGFLGQLIEREMGNWGGVIIDKLHGFAQGWRA